VKSSGKDEGNQVRMHLSLKTFDELLPSGENRRVASPRGPVAQLGARFHGMEEVIGSIPIRSTKPSQQLRAKLPGTLAIFRERSGYFPMSPDPR
jgi:hypothetical protein